MVATKGRPFSVAFLCIATFIAAAAALAVVLLLAARRFLSQINTPYLNSQTENSHAAHLSEVALVVVIAAEIALLWRTDLGRRSWFIPLAVQIVLCLGFAFACYTLFSGYIATGGCTGPHNCVIVDPVPTGPSLVAGLIVGVLFGVGWRLSAWVDDRRVKRTPAR